MAKKSYYQESWLAKNWRPLAFVVYAIICLFDFVIMPTIFEMNNKHIQPDKIVSLALQFKDSATQIAFISQYNPTNQWQPLTMGGAAAFHFAFGAILTGAAWTRGQQLIERQRQQNQPIINPGPFKLGRQTPIPDNPGA